jgi:hypothetical protein
MNKYLIRFNKTRGNPGRGTKEHVWRVFENGQEYLFKHFQLHVPSFSERENNSEDWNVCCFGIMEIDRQNSIAIIKPKPQTLTTYDATQICTHDTNRNSNS